MDFFSWNKRLKSSILINFYQADKKFNSPHQCTAKGSKKPISIGALTWVTSAEVTHMRTTEPMSSKPAVYFQPIEGTSARRRKEAMPCCKRSVPADLAWFIAQAGSFGSLMMNAKCPIFGIQDSWENRQVGFCVHKILCSNYTILRRWAIFSELGKWSCKYEKKAMYKTSLIRLRIACMLKSIIRQLKLR